MRYLGLLFISAIIFLGCESITSNADTTGPSYIIKYAIPQATFVRLTLENSYNTIVDTLVNGVTDIGFHSVTVNSYKYPEGVYFYTLKAGQYEVTNKLLFIKK